MDIKEYLLASLGEESGEVQQAVGKSLRFGLLDTNPELKNGKTNWVQLRQEIHDVIALYEMLCDEFDRVGVLDRKLIATKKVKVEKWMKHSIEVGILK